MKKGCLILISVIIILLGIIYYAVHLLVQNHIESQLSQSESQQLTSFFNQTIPERFFQLPEISDEQKTQLKKAFDLADEYNITNIDTTFLSVLQSDINAPNVDWHSIERQVTSCKPYLDLLQQLVKREDYDLVAWMIPPEKNQTSRGFLHVQVGAKLLCIEAIDLARQKEWQKSFKICLDAFRLAQHNSNSTLITRLFAYAVIGISVRSSVPIVQACDDPQALRFFLNELKKLRPAIINQEYDHILHLDIITHLYLLKEEGYEVDLTPRNPGRFYYRQLQDIQREKAVNMLNQRNNPNLNPEMTTARIFRALGFSKEMDMLMLSTLIRNTHNIDYRGKNAAVKHHLIFLNTASQIFTLEKGKRISHPSDLIPVYIKKLPPDPFTQDQNDSPYIKFARNPRRFYSIGPDFSDDNAQIIYDSSNGLKSKGDIFLNF